MANVPYSSENVASWTEYITRVTYTFCTIYSPTKHCLKNVKKKHHSDYLFSVTDIFYILNFYISFYLKLFHMNYNQKTLNYRNEYLLNNPIH